MNFDFIGKRKFAYALSCILIIAGIVSLFVQGLNFGVDFTGGTVYQIQFEDEKDIADLRSELGDMGYDGAQIQELQNGAFQIRTDFMDQSAQDDFTSVRKFVQKKLQIRAWQICSLFFRSVFSWTSSTCRTTMGRRRRSRNRSR